MERTRTLRQTNWVPKGFEHLNGQNPHHRHESCDPTLTGQEPPCGSRFAGAKAAAKAQDSLGLKPWA
jgi:hypothetical protein